MQPNVKIDVNEATGVWETDGLPMLYIPRHFMINVHDAVEQALGLAAYRDVLKEAGAKAAFYWCKKQADSGKIAGLQVFEHYLERLTVRGWGQFKLDEINPESGTATITLENSVYVLEGAANAQRPVCYMFEGFFIGGAKYLAEHDGLNWSAIECREVQCQAMGFDHCRFELKANRAGS
ncbi:DUF5943 domain-containing protein [Phyllobacterium sp. K27]